MDPTRTVVVTVTAMGDIAERETLTKAMTALLDIAARGYTVSIYTLAALLAREGKG